MSLDFNVGGKKIALDVALDDVINYNDEYGFDKNDVEYKENWTCANVSVSIGNIDLVGQVQYDDLNKCYSVDCDGNSFGVEIKDALLANFENDVLYTTINDNVCQYTVESDLYCDLINLTLPKIIDYIVKFGNDEINK